MVAIISMEEGRLILCLSCAKQRNGMYLQTALLFLILQTTASFHVGKQCWVEIQQCALIGSAIDCTLRLATPDADGDIHSSISREATCLRTYRQQQPQLMCCMLAIQEVDLNCENHVDLLQKQSTHRGARTHDHKVKSLALCRLS